MPDVALLFYKNKQQVDIIFSFTGGQLQIECADGKQIYKKYKSERLIAIYFQRFLQKENLQLFIDNLNY